ncbi:hypothetical protein ACFLZG_02625 [Thermodesulfobacteriota bacterium]
MARKFFKRAIRIIFGLTAFSMIALCIPMAESGEKIDQVEILVIGTGRIIGENIAAARKAAISEALAKGVEEYLIRYLGSQGMTNNFTRLIHEIIPGAREEIENFHILTEDKGDKYYKILVRIKVNEKLMEERLKDMGIILMEGPPIKLLFLVSQEKMQEGEISFWWNDPDSNAVLTTTELVLHRVFQERGFSPVNRMLSVPEEKISLDMRRLELSDEAAIAWAGLFSSDVAILGKSEIIEGELVSVSLKAIDIKKNTLINQDHQIVSIDEDTMDAEQVMETLERAIKNIVIRLGPEIIKSFEESEETVNALKIELRGLKSFEQFRTFRDFLKGNFKGVKSVTQTRIKGDSITILVEFSGKKDTFLDKILAHEKFPFLADVSKTEEGEVVFNIK